MAGLSHGTFVWIWNGGVQMLWNGSSGPALFWWKSGHTLKREKTAGSWLQCIFSPLTAPHWFPVRETQCFADPRGPPWLLLQPCLFLLAGRHGSHTAELAQCLSAVLCISSGGCPDTPKRWWASQWPCARASNLRGCSRLVGECSFVAICLRTAGQESQNCRLRWPAFL